MYQCIVKYKSSTVVVYVRILGHTVTWRDQLKSCQLPHITLVDLYVIYTEITRLGSMGPGANPYKHLKIKIILTCSFLMAMGGS